ncbi:Multifunctional CCA protein [compost metagenome]
MLLELLQKFDVYRRPQRFEDYIAACEMIARGRQQLQEQGYPQGAYLRAAAQEAKAVDVKGLVERGLSGQALGEALKAERLAALERFTQA